MVPLYDFEPEDADQADIADQDDIADHDDIVDQADIADHGDKADKLEKVDQADETLEVVDVEEDDITNSSENFNKDYYESHSIRTLEWLSWRARKVNSKDIGMFKRMSLINIYVPMYL